VSTPSGPTTTPSPAGLGGPVLLVAGARPNFMKVAPLQAELDRRAIPSILVHTGQHYDPAMSDVFFDELGIRPARAPPRGGLGSHAVQTARIMEAFEAVVLAETHPRWVVVPGDVNSTLACSLVAAKLGVKVAHLEAGLRSRDWTMPEEVNRVVTDRVSDLLLAPSADAVDNLRPRATRSDPWPWWATSWPTPCWPTSSGRGPAAHPGGPGPRARRPTAWSPSTGPATSTIPPRSASLLDVLE
jgi:hypothetical protein